MEKTKTGDPMTQDVMSSTLATVPILPKKETFDISLLACKQEHTLPRMDVDLKGSKEVHLEVPQMDNKDGDIRWKLFPPSPHKLLDLSPDIGAMTLDPKKPTIYPHTNAVPEST